MNSTINICDNIYIQDCKKQLTTIYNTFNLTNQDKNLILYKNKNNAIRDNLCEKLTLLKLINLNYCTNCEKYADYIGLCINHFNQNNINTYIKEYYEYIKQNNNIDYIHEYLNEYRKTIKKYKTMCKKILDCYNKTISFTFDINKHNYYMQYINNTYDINYNKINVNFNKNIACDIIRYYHFKYTQQINIIILIKFLHRKYNFDLYTYKNIFKKNTPTNIFIGNNNILFNHIFNSNLINNIEFIDTEYPINIDGHTLRFDIYIIIKIMDIDDDIAKFKYFKLVIETDENHHYQNIDHNKTYDKLKDKYCIENEISLFRIYIKNNKICESDITLCLFFINYLIKTKKPIYYFPPKYVNFHENTTKNVSNNITNVDINNIDINNINVDDILTFGSNKKKLIDNIDNINNFKKIDDIPNIDYYIKNHLISLIQKFTYKDIEIDDSDESTDEYNDYIINFHKNISKSKS